MKRLVQRLIKAYESRPSTESPERAKWDTGNIIPAKQDVEKFAESFLTMTQLREIKKSLSRQMAEAMGNMKMAEAMAEIIKAKMPELNDGEILNCNLECSKKLIGELEDLIAKFDGMLTVLESAEMTGSIKECED